MLLDAPLSFDDSPLSTKTSLPTNMIAFAVCLFLLAAPAFAAPQRGGSPPQGGSTAAAGGTTADGEDVPAIQDAGEYYVLNFTEDPNEGMNLAEFVKACQEATGRNFTYDQATDSLLQGQKIRMFGSKRVPKEDFYPFFQIMMFIYDFACVEVGPSHLSVVVIQSLAQGAGGARGIRQKAIFVDPNELDDYADKPAELITTTVHLPNTDVRQLSTSLRALMTDNNTQNITPAGQSDNLVLTGFGSNIAALAKLLLLIDEQSRIADDPPPVFDVIPLEFATAEDVADLIDQLLEASGRVSQNQRRARPQEQGVSGVIGNNQSEAKILVDTRTNSLLVMALPDDMPRIKDLVARLDVEVIEPERNFHIYSLQNVNADDIAQVLEDFLQDAGRLTQSSGGGARGGAGGAGGTASSSRDSDVVVVPDPESNSLLIAANKSRYEEVLDIIGRLDQRQDQVLIETALVELTGSNVRDIGFEWGLADLPEGGDGAFGLTSFGLSTVEDLNGNDGIPDTRVPIVADGITAGILEGDEFNLPLLLRFIENEDNANVLSIPSILVNNNGSATVSTVDEQPFTQVTANGVGGQTQENFQGYEEAGITLTISPSISASRYLRLGVELSVSNFAGSFSGSIPPPRTTRELRTSVNVPDGDTMVIGGIVTDNKTESEDKVPFLGDIPLIGSLFKRSSTTSQRTTLYFFVTPHILHDRDFADLAEISYQKKLQASEIIGLDRVQVIDPAFGESRDDLELGAFEVPLYRSPSHGEVDSASVGLDPEDTRELLEARRNEELGGTQ